MDTISDTIAEAVTTEDLHRDVLELIPLDKPYVSASRIVKKPRRSRKTTPEKLQKLAAYYARQNI